MHSEYASNQLCDAERSVRVVSIYGVAMTIKAHVRATVTIEFDLGNWSGNSCFNDLNDQCAKEAITMVRGKMSHAGLQIIGQPKIQVATFYDASK